MVVYITDKSFNVYKLPYPVEEQVFVNDHFLITPLLPMTSMDGTFNLLAVSRQRLRLLQCTRNDVSEITLNDVSTSVEDYLEVDPEKQLQFHSGSRGQKAVYFGHNANEEDKMVVVEMYGESSTEMYSNNLGDIVEATVMGKSNTIFIAQNEQRWGFYDAENHTVQYSNNSNQDGVELLNWLSITGFKTGSKVYSLPKEEMPTRSTVAAEFRF